VINTSKMPVHPGRILRETVLPEAGISVEDAALALGNPLSSFKNILAEQMSLSAVLCLKIAKLSNQHPRAIGYACRPITTCKRRSKTKTWPAAWRALFQPCRAPMPWPEIPLCSGTLEGRDNTPVVGRPVSGARLHTATEERLIRPAKNIYGSIRLPGDKSISHRYGMLAAFAEGTSRFANFSTGDDCASTLACMEALGATVSRAEEGIVAVTGIVGAKLNQPTGPLDCGNSGSTMRMIFRPPLRPAGRIHPDWRRFLSRRPMKRIQTPLEAMGARLTLT